MVDSARMDQISSKFVHFGSVRDKTKPVRNFGPVHIFSPFRRSNKSPQSASAVCLFHAGAACMVCKPTAMLIVWRNFVQICSNFIQILTGYRSEFSEFRPIQWAPNVFRKRIPDPWSLIDMSGHMSKDKTQQPIAKSHFRNHMISFLPSSIVVTH